MADIEKAIERFKICLECDDCLTCGEHDEAIKVAIQTLEEKFERENQIFNNNTDRYISDINSHEE